MTAHREEISISHLKQGMYVIEVIKKGSAVKIKSEGYILNPDTIKQLKNNGINRVIIDPSKEKSPQVIEKSLNKSLPSSKPDVNEQPEQASTKKEQSKKISFEDEMAKAKTLYQDAKQLQHKIVEQITNGKDINIDEVSQTSNAIVDSIFRNQDALACMSRLRCKDEYLVEHALNVSTLMGIFAKHLKLDRNIIEQLTLGAFLHDIGKILIPKKLLNKPSKLTDEEFIQIKKHVNLGLSLIKNKIDISPIAQSVIALHHERLDGSGYPNQLNQDDISMYGRMIAIVDSYDAMTSERVYKKSVHPIKAFKILVSDAISAYDEELVEQFIQCIGVYPIGTLVKLNSGKLGLISRLNKKRPLHPFVHVFYNTRLNQAIPMAEIDLSKSKYQDQIDRCIKPEEFKLDLIKFFTHAFLDY